MPVPSVATYSAAALIAAHTTFRDLIDAGPAAGYVNVLDVNGLVLATCPLQDPCGTVNGTTGKLTFLFNGIDEAAAASGTIVYVEVCDSTGLVHLALPVQAGTSAVSGKAVFNTLNVLAGGPVEILSLTIG